VVIAVCAAACGATDEAKTITATTPVVDLSKNPDYQKGLELVASHDCLSCHTVSEKLLGPSYRSIAGKYDSSAVSSLAQKIIKGGQGVWGQVPMTPHPQVSKADAEQMVKYILLLKSK
jgi:cytochrome c